MSGNDAIIALERANQALDRIDKHEAICSERYAKIFDSQSELSNKLDDIKTSGFRQWILVASGVITMLLSMVGGLFAKVMGWW